MHSGQQTPIKPANPSQKPSGNATAARRVLFVLLPPWTFNPASGVRFRRSVPWQYGGIRTSGRPGNAIAARWVEVQTSAIGVHLDHAYQIMYVRSWLNMGAVAFLERKPDMFVRVLRPRIYLPPGWKYP